MPTVRFRFPGGRYHATPWGHHVNEGLIEWPPSPWRLLRALIATGFAHLGWQQIPPTAVRLIETLAGVMPFYRLPVAAAAHSRHYMPYIEGKAQKTTLVFDTWANVGDGELLVHWPCALEADEAELLAALTCSLSYLGRSESWVEAELVADRTVDWNCVPCADGEDRGPAWETISLFAPVPPEHYLQWRRSRTEQPAAAAAPVKRRGPKKVKSDDDGPCPQDLISCLTKDTAWWKNRGWSQPPGSRRVLYWRKSDCLQVALPISSPPVRYESAAVVLLALTTASGNRGALPACERTLPQAERFHRQIVATAGNGRAVDCPEITGRDAQGRPLRASHEHAHIVPLDLDADGRIDHLLVFARSGLGDAAQRAIRQVKRTWAKGGVGDIQVALAGVWRDLAASVVGIEALALPTSMKRRLTAVFGPPGGAAVWKSASPFVPPRFLKRRGKNTLAGQIQAELQSRRLPLAKEIAVDPDLTRELRHFVRVRARGGVAPPIDVGFGLRLEFSEPISGPLLLGYASHFGLGLFVADES